MASASSPLDLNQLSVSLDSPPHPRQVYLPGDSVQGYINLQNPYHASGLQASISFAGLSRVRFKETRLFSSAHSHDDEFIAWRKANLACTKHHDALIWNFQFCIPTEEHSRSFPHEESFSKRAADALTPTFCTSQIAGNNNLTHKKGEDKYATVTYILKADLAKPHFSHSYPGPTACQIPLPLSPIRLQTFGDLPPNVVSSSHHIPPPKLTTRVLDQSDYAHFGLRNDPVNAHKLFWKSMRPCLDVEVSIPKCAIIGRKLDIKLRIDHNLKQLPAEKLPQVILEAVRIELVSETRVRIPDGPRRDPQTKWTKMISYYILNATRIPVEKRSRKLTMSKANGWYATVLVPELKNDLRVTPSFATPSLSHSYYLRVRGRWKCDNGEIRVDVEKPLIVLSAYGREDALLSKGQSTSQSDSGHHGDDETSAPPPYTEACGGEIALPSYVNALKEKF